MKRLPFFRLAIPVAVLGFSVLLAGCGGGSGSNSGPGPTGPIAGNYAGEYTLGDFGDPDAEFGNLAATITDRNSVTFTFASPAQSRLVSVSGPILNSGRVDFRTTVSVDGAPVTFDFDGEVDDELPTEFIGAIKSQAKKLGATTSTQRLKIASHAGLYLFGDLTIISGNNTLQGDFVTEGLPTTNPTVGSYTGSFTGDVSGTFSLQVDRTAFGTASLVTGGRTYTGRAIADPSEGTITIVFDLSTTRRLQVAFQGEFFDTNPVRIEGEYEDSDERTGNFTLVRR